MIGRPPWALSIALLLASLASLPASAGQMKALPQLNPTTANFGPGCNLALRVPEGAYFPVTYSARSGHGGSTLMLEGLPLQQYKVGHLYLGTVCYDARTANVMSDAPVRYDAKQSQWVRYIGNELMQWDMGNGLAPETVKSIDESVRVYALDNVNSRGFAYTIDDWTGEEKTRMRRLKYCLFLGEAALWGRGDMGALADGPKGDLTPYVLQILRSIEFLPDASPAPAASAPRP